MTVTVIAWDDRGAVAVVDGVRCRIRRRAHSVRWICATHGTGPTPHCDHLVRLASEPADPRKRAT